MGSQGEFPKGPDPDQEMLMRYALEAVQHVDATNGGPINMRRVSDRIFQTVQASERLAKSLLRDREMTLRVNVQGDPQKIDQEEYPFRAAAVVAMTAGAHVADRWETLTVEDRATYLRDITRTLTEQVIAANFDTTVLMQQPMWGRVMREFLDDAANTDDEALDVLREGLPPQVLQSEGNFSVEKDEDHSHQIGSIVGSTLHRLHRLCAEERRTVKTEIAGWEKWRNHLVIPTEADIPALTNIYNDVRIPYEWFADLASNQSEIREAALDKIQKYGGFIHPSDPEESRETLKHGVMRMTDDGSAYYGLITDPNIVQQHLQRFCGFDPHKNYFTKDDLPKQSQYGEGKTWNLEWNADPAYAVTMFQHPHQVALSVEVAVKRDPKPAASSNGRGRRNSGIAAALKHGVYTDPSVDQAWVLTRHFQIVEVGIPEMKREKQLVSRAINVGSDQFIRMLGGCEIGSGTEQSTIQVPDQQGRIHPVELTVRWIYCLAPRKKSIEMIEQRGNRA